MEGDPRSREQVPRGLGAWPASVIVCFDGASQEKGGRRVAGYGFTVLGAGMVHEGYGLALPPGSPHSTNNVAEYSGAICGLEWLNQRGYAGSVVLRGDSQLVIRQMTGEYAVEAEHLRAYHDRLKALCARFASVSFEWVPRTENQRADELSKIALIRA